MKARISAVIAIFALAAWLPIQAQRAATPSAPATQAATAPDEKSKDAAAQSCCHPKAKAGEEATSEKADQAAMQCCQNKGADAVESACCAGKEAKEMAGCCEGKKKTMCAAKDGKTCCGT